MKKENEQLNINRKKFYCLDSKSNNALNCFSRINSYISQLVNLIKLNVDIDEYSMSRTLMLIKYLLLTLKEALKFISNVIENENLKLLIPNEADEIINELSSEILNPKLAVDTFNARILTKVRDDIAHYSIDNKQEHKNTLILTELINQEKNMIFTQANKQIDFELFTDILFINNISETERREMLLLADKIRLLSKQVLIYHIKNNMKV